MDGNERKMAAGRYSIELEREAKERQGTRTDLTLAPIGAEVDFGKSAEVAAEKFNESTRSVERAVKIIKEGAAELIQAVEQGQVTKVLFQVLRIFLLKLNAFKRIFCNQVGLY